MARGVEVTGVLAMLGGVTGVSSAVVGLVSMDCFCSSLCFARFDLAPCLIGDAKRFPNAKLGVFRVSPSGKMSTANTRGRLHIALLHFKSSQPTSPSFWTLGNAVKS